MRQSLNTRFGNKHLIKRIYVTSIYESLLTTCTSELPLKRKRTVKYPIVKKSKQWRLNTTPRRKRVIDYGDALVLKSKLEKFRIYTHRVLLSQIDAYFSLLRKFINETFFKRGAVKKRTEVIYIQVEKISWTELRTEYYVL